MQKREMAWLRRIEQRRLARKQRRLRPSLREMARAKLRQWASDDVRHSVEAALGHLRY